MSTIQVASRIRGPHRIGEKGQLTIPKAYRDELGLDTGAPVAVLRIGEGLILIPEHNRFRILCESIASVLDRRQLTPRTCWIHCRRRGGVFSFALPSVDRAGTK